MQHQTQGNGVTVDQALAVLSEERANQIARRDAMNVTAGALLGFGAVLVQLLVSEKHPTWSTYAALWSLLVGLGSMVLCLLDWRIEPAALHPRVGRWSNWVREKYSSVTSSSAFQSISVHLPVKRHNPDTIDPVELAQIVVVSDQDEAELYATVTEMITSDHEEVIKPKRTKLVPHQATFALLTTSRRRSLWACLFRQMM